MSFEWSLRVFEFWLAGRRPPVLFNPMDNILRNLAVSDRLQSAHEWIGLFYNCGFTALWVSACNGGM